MASEKNGGDRLSACLKMHGQLDQDRCPSPNSLSFPSAVVKKNGKGTKWRKTFDLVIFVMMTSLISWSSKCLKVRCVGVLHQQPLCAP